VRERRAWLIGVAAGVVVIVIWYLALWSPRSGALGRQRTRLDSAQQQTQQLQTQLSRLRQQQRNEPVVQAQLETLKAAIPDDPALAQFILDTNDAATKSGVDFLSISPTPPSAPATPAAGTAGASGSSGASATPAALPASKRPAEIKIALNVTGGYFQVLDFINRLDALPRLVVIDTLSLSGGGGTTGGPIKLTAQISARMFLRQLPATGTGGTSASTSTTSTTSPAGAGSTTTTTAASR